MSPADESRFRALLEEHRSILSKVAYGYSRGPADRDDLVQEMAIQLWRAFPRFDGRVKFSTWAYRVAMNVAISHVRSATRPGRETVPLEDTESAPDATLGEAADNMRVLRRLVDGLDEMSRALVLLYLDGHSADEIAAIVGISPTNVSTRVNRLKQQLQREFARLDKPKEVSA